MGWSTSSWLVPTLWIEWDLTPSWREWHIQVCSQPHLWHVALWVCVHASTMNEYGEFTFCFTGRYMAIQSRSSVFIEGAIPLLDVKLPHLGSSFTSTKATRHDTQGWISFNFCINSAGKIFCISDIFLALRYQMNWTAVLSVGSYRETGSRSQ